jgi:uncharacterized protein involved in exopolysaccharide biosynthesis
LLLSVLTDSDKMRQTDFFKEFNSNPEAAKEHLLRNFNVQPITNSRLIAVEMTYRVPRDARTIVEEVVSRYISDQRARVAETWGSKAQQLEDQYNTQEREYRKITDELTSQSKKLGSKESFALYGMLEIRRHEMFRLTEALQRAEADLTEAKNARDTMNAMIDSGDTPPEIEAELFKDDLSSDYQRELNQIDMLAGQSGGPNSPKAASLLKRRTMVQQNLDDRRETLRSAELAARRVKLQTEFDTADAGVKMMAARLEVAKAELQTMNAAAANYKLLEENQKTVKEKMDKLSEELEKIQNRKLPSNWAPVEWFTRPPTPETPSFPQLPITMAVAVMLGLALSVGIAFLREITDQTVRSPRDIARVGNLNLLGMIPHESDDPQAAGARLPLVIFDAPHSMAAEEFRKLRTRLQHTASLDSTRSILVSSANPGDGKTAVACNLAAGLALNGRRILLVDANFRRPDIHNIFEVANEKGLSDALNDLSTFDTLVRDTPVQNLYVMPTGPKP